MSDHVGDPPGRALFLAALALDEDARTRLLHDAAQQDPSLAAEVTSLLAAHARADALLPVRAGDANGPLVTGDRVGDFVIEGTLGRGGFGDVYRARQAGLGRSVALKVARSTRPDAGAALVREARAAAQAHAAHLVEVYVEGFDRQRQLAWYAMRLVEGRTLAEVLRDLEGPPPIPVRRELVRIAREVCLALEALHAAGFVHRDVAPGNVVLEGADGVAPWTAPARLLDYGLLRPTDAAVSIPLGTPGYVAPEVTTGARVDARADVFGVGALLHDLLAGRRAGAGATRFTDLRHLDGALRAIVTKATADEPADRHADARALGADLAAWLEGRRASPTRAPRRLRRALAVVVIAVGVCFGVVARQRAHADALWAEGALRLAHAVPLRLAGFDARAFPGSEDPAVAAVLREGAAHGEAGALLLAARHLERDGLAAHPTLAAYLRWAIGAARSPEVQTRALRLAGRLFHERADASAADTAASAALRAGLQSALDHPDADARAWACVALAGCGTPAQWPALLARVRATPEDPHLAIAALRGIVQREVDCGFGAELAPLPLDRDVAALADALSAPGKARIVASGCDRLAVETAFCLRRLGRPVDAIRAALGAAFPWVAAATLDPALRARLVATGPAVPEDRHFSAAYGEVQRYGELVGAYGDRDLADFARNAVARAAQAQGLDPSFAQQVFGEACALTAAERDGRGVRDDPDPDTHLGAGLGADPAPQVAVACRPDPVAQHGKHVAGWKFQVHPPLTTGGARSVSARAVRIGVPQEMTPDHTYARMAAFGTSSLELEFEAPAAAALAFAVQLTVQKGLRRRLPQGGIALLDVSLDDVFVTRLPLTSGSVEESRLPIGVPPPGRHRLRLDLHADSTTTLRVIAVAIER